MCSNLDFVSSIKINLEACVKKYHYFTVLLQSCSGLLAKLSLRATRFLKIPSIKKSSEIFYTLCLEKNHLHIFT